MTAAEIRASFLDFFRARGHEIVPSAPLVLPTDPTLLFANAGMNPFKEIFLGARTSKYPRVADTQKCIRVSGKHNDLEEVGHDTYHHTFFEMLGNWSFGDYYKREAITWAWELLTGVWGLPKDRLWVTVYRTDDEAARLWTELTDVLPAHVLRFDEKDNFWEMGETGPCGPCSEIHIDISADGLGPEWVNAGSPELIELWNLVFIQYNRRADGRLEELPSKHVDTGMGLERVVAVMQGKRSNYDSDLFMPLIEQVAALSGRAYAGEDAVAMRVIADHLRALSFALADGVTPGNDGRGYVLRRLLRRAVRYGRTLGLEQPFLGALYPTLEKMLGPVFPELGERRATVLRALQAEEESFAATLDRGLALFDEVVADLRAAGQTVFPGAAAFKLYDTFGFPPDLTALMAREQELGWDQDAFDAEMTGQRERARAARRDGAHAQEMDQVAQLVQQGLQSVFTGYDEETTREAEVLGLLDEQGQPCDALATGAAGLVLLERTPFYAESGGQGGCRGTLTGAGAAFAVRDTQRPAAGLILHQGVVTVGTLRRGDRLEAAIDTDRRKATRRHHTATHLLNHALRETVGAEIKQAGSHVSPERLRFDFNHYEALTPAQLEALEVRVNDSILEDTEVRTYEMELKDVPGSGIVAVFDEKYGDVVRVLDVGGYSRELCGGTHVARTGEIGFFRIVSESAVAAGVRRIEAVCGRPAGDLARREHALLRRLAQRFSIAEAELEDRIEQLQAQNRQLERALKEQAARQAATAAGDLVNQRQQVGDVTLIAAFVGEHNLDELRAMMDTVRAAAPDDVIVLGSASEGKACFMAAVGPAAQARGLHAGKLVGAVAKKAGGGGGGKPDRAQAGARDGAAAPAAIAAVPEILAATPLQSL
ncbi:MAG: alanine--tRNA ligase [Candidatus Marinimicrobia bacterium]|nr:alanine--tRNA ligase [Candidatus Neomarinimicrobiota bacterium]